MTNPTQCTTPSRSLGARGPFGDLIPSWLAGALLAINCPPGCLVPCQSVGPQSHYLSPCRLLLGRWRSSGSLSTLLAVPHDFSAPSCHFMELQPTRHSPGHSAPSLLFVTLLITMHNFLPLGLLRATWSLLAAHLTHEIVEFLVSRTLDGRTASVK